jgi:hypothetical protein
VKKPPPPSPALSSPVSIAGWYDEWRSNGSRGHLGKEGADDAAGFHPTAARNS